MELRCDKYSQSVLVGHASQNHQAGNEAERSNGHTRAQSRGQGVAGREENTQHEDPEVTEVGVGLGNQAPADGNVARTLDVDQTVVDRQHDVACVADRLVRQKKAGQQHLWDRLVGGTGEERDCFGRLALHQHQHVQVPRSLEHGGWRVVLRLAPENAANTAQLGYAVGNPLRIKRREGGEADLRSRIGIRDVDVAHIVFARV